VIATSSTQWLDGLRDHGVPIVAWGLAGLVCVLVVGALVVRVAAGRLRRRAFGPGGGLK